MIEHVTVLDTRTRLWTRGYPSFCVMQSKTVSSHRLDYVFDKCILSCQKVNSTLAGEMPFAQATDDSGSVYREYGQGFLQPHLQPALTLALHNNLFILLQIFAFPLSLEIDFIKGKNIPTLHICII